MLLKLATDHRLSVTLPDLRERHTILDVLDLHDVIEFRDEVEAQR